MRVGIFKEYIPVYVLYYRIIREEVIANISFINIERIRAIGCGYEA